MKTSKILIDELYKNISDAGLEYNSSDLKNVLFMQRNDNGRLYKVIKKRPGYISWNSVSTGDIKETFWWEKYNKVIAVSSDDIVYFDSDGTKTSIKGVGINGNNRPIFTENFSGNIFLASGGRIIKCDHLNDSFSEITATNAPVTATHVTFLNQYIIANESNEHGVFKWSNVNDVDTWDGSNIASAESSSGKIQAIHSANGRLYIFKTDSVEQWYNDLTGFSPISGSSISIGCIEPYTIQKINDMFIWLDSTKRIVILQNNTIKYSSHYIDNYIRSLNITNAYSYIIEIEGQTLYVLNLPNENLTIVYSLTYDYFVTWSYFDNHSIHNIFEGKTYVFAKTWAKHFIGVNNGNNCYLYELSSDYLSDNNNTLKAEIKTGNVSHGTSVLKQNVRLRITLRRGDGISSDLTKTPFLMVKWKNDNKQWRGEKWLSMGRSGDYDFIVKINNMGRYRYRKLNLDLSDKVPLEIIDIEEDYRIIQR